MLTPSLLVALAARLRGLSSKLTPNVHMLPTNLSTGRGGGTVTGIEQAEGVKTSLVPFVVQTTISRPATRESLGEGRCG